MSHYKVGTRVELTGETFTDKLIKKATPVFITVLAFYGFVSMLIDLNK